jgi:hypothetical protein
MRKVEKAEDRTAVGYRRDTGRMNSRVTEKEMAVHS